MVHTIMFGVKTLTVYYYRGLELLEDEVRLSGPEPDDSAVDKIADMIADIVANRIITTRTFFIMEV